MEVTGLVWLTTPLKPNPSWRTYKPHFQMREEKDHE